LSIISQGKPLPFYFILIPLPLLLQTSSPAPFSFEKERYFSRSCPSKEKGRARRLVDCDMLFVVNTRNTYIYIGKNVILIGF